MDSHASAVSLSDVLRERTSALHAEAERSGIINDILRKRADRLAYALFLRNLLPANEEMERALERHRGSPVLRTFARPELYRAQRIASDLAVLCGDDWVENLPLLTAGKDYGADVAEAGRGDGLGLMAHAYVRYFGDLSGGQVLRRLLGTSLALPPGALSMYEFPDVRDPHEIKRLMRKAIDEADVTGSERELIIEEAVGAFRHNIEVSRAVQALFVSEKDGALAPA
jgi:heme oxygenase